MAYQKNEFRERIALGQSNNTLTALIVINLIVFVILAFIKVIYLFIYKDDQQALSLYQNQVLLQVALPADLSQLASKPWTVFTHMFAHDGLLHILGNMLWLWAFGYIMQDLTGNGKIIPVFIYGALMGAVFFVVAYNVFPGFESKTHLSTLHGASAGIMGIAVATTMTAPNYRLFPMLNGGIPIWIILALYLVVDLATIPYDNPGGHIAHLGGAFMGMLFILMMRRGYDGSEWMNRFFDWFNNLFNPDKPVRGKTVKEELFYKSKTQPFNRRPNVTQQRIDAILDKINQKGFNQLTDEEKELLKRASEEEL